MTALIMDRSQFDPWCSEDADETLFITCGVVWARIGPLLSDQESKRPLKPPPNWAT